MPYPMITGHTGNDGTPANSIASIIKSISLGADAFEVDIRRAENSVLVLSHDTGNQGVYDRCPTLSDALEIAAQHPEIRINCDLKDNDLPLEVIELAHSFGIGANRLILSGFVTPSYLSVHPEITELAIVYLNAEWIVEPICLQMASQTENHIRYQDFHDKPWKYIREIIPRIDRYIGILSETCLRYGVKGINIPYGCLTDESIKVFKKDGVSISAWTVNDEVEMARLLTHGVENLTTCYVSKAKSVRMSLFGF